MATFKLPANGHTEYVTWRSGLAFALFGPIYLMFKGMWAQALAWCGLILCTFGIAWVVGWFVIPSQIKRNFLRQGYVQQ